MEGIKNFCISIKPIMLKVKNGEKLTEDDRYRIVQFYLEVVNIASVKINDSGFA